MPKLKGVSPLSSLKLEAVMVSKLKVGKPSDSLELKVELVRLVMFELKGVSSLSSPELKVELVMLKLSPSSSPKLGLGLVRRMMVEPIRSLILI
jgi:hypothetical protein